MHDNRSSIHGIKSSSSGFVALVLWSSLFSTIPLFTFHFMIHQRYGLPCTSWLYALVCSDHATHHFLPPPPSSSFLPVPVDDVVHRKSKRVFGPRWLRVAALSLWLLSYSGTILCGNQWVTSSMLFFHRGWKLLQSAADERKERKEEGKGRCLQDVIFG